MHLHVITHVPFEGPARVAEWAHERGHTWTESLALTEEYPNLASVGVLVVMGGPMAADDHGTSPWLKAEKRYLADAIDAGVPMLGICLGSQILAEVAGGRVRRNREPEIGWYPLRRSAAAETDPVFSGFPDGLIAGHWHADTFDLSSGAEPMLSSEACANQAFSLGGGRLVGLQFHLEWSPGALEMLLDACGDELDVSGTYVSTAAEMRAGALSHGQACRDALWDLLDKLALLHEESV